MAWVVTGDIVSGQQQLWIGVEADNLFSPAGTTTCSCGLTFIDGVPGSFNALDAVVTVTSTTIPHLPGYDPSTDPNRVTAFDSLAFDAGTGNDFDNLPGAQGGTYSGFKGSVSSFTVPTLNPDEIFKFWFKVEVAVADVSSLLASNLQYGAGDFTDPGHQPTFSGVMTVPEPTTAMLLLLGLAGLTAHRRARQRE